MKVRAQASITSSLNAALSHPPHFSVLHPLTPSPPHYLTPHPHYTTHWYLLESSPMEAWRSEFTSRSRARQRHPAACIKASLPWFEKAS